MNGEVRHYVCLSCRAIEHGIEPDIPEGWTQKAYPYPGPTGAVIRFTCPSCSAPPASPPMVVQAVRGISTSHYFAPGQLIKLHRNQRSLCGWRAEFRMSDDAEPTCPECRDAWERYYA